MPENNVETPRKRGSLKKKVGLTLAGVAVAGAGFLGADKEAKTVEAVDNTPTPIPTRTVTPPTPTSTPDAKEQKIAALQTAVAQATKERGKDQQIADLEKQLTPTLTPTNTPRPTEIPIPLSPAEALATRNAGIDAKVEATVVSAQLTATARAGGTATVEAETSATAQARETATAIQTNRNRANQDGGIPVVPLAAAAVAGVAGWANRRRIVDAVRNPATRAGALDLGRRAWNFTRTQGGRAITAIRTRLHI